MRVDVAFTPAEELRAPLAIVVDVIRATSTMAQALSAGYERILCCAEIDDARRLREELAGEAILGGEREARKIEGFDVGASPREFLQASAKTLILSTTNGTRAIVSAASRCDEVLLGSLLNLDAAVAIARESAGDVVILCAGFRGGFAIDDAYCAGRFVHLLEGKRSDAAVAAALIADAFPTAIRAIEARTYGPPGLEADIAFCSQENLLTAVPRFSRMVGPAAEVVLV